jgi:hypothetical protein
MHETNDITLKERVADAMNQGHAITNGEAFARITMAIITMEKAIEACSACMRPELVRALNLLKSEEAKLEAKFFEFAPGWVNLARDVNANPDLDTAVPAHELIEEAPGQEEAQRWEAA